MKSRAWIVALSLALASLSAPAAEPSAAPSTAKAAPAADRVAALRAELEAMHETDQAQRQEMSAVEREHGQNSPQMAELWKKQSASDTRNIRRLEEIIAEQGWPKRSVFGERAASAAFLILQHSDLSYQKKYLPLARAAVAENEMRGSSLALLEDRILQEVVAQHGWSWPVFFDGQGWNNALAERFQIKMLPHYLLIDRQGILRFRGMQVTTPTAAQRLATLVAEKSPPAVP